MNTVAERVSPSITTMIRMDHTHVLAVFHRYRADLPPTKKRALVTNACLLLEVHAQLEEEIFYPALREVLTGDEVLDKSEPDHAEMKTLIGELRGMAGQNGPAGSAGYDEKFYQLMRIVIH